VLLSRSRARHELVRVRRDDFECLMGTYLGRLVMKDEHLSGVELPRVSLLCQGVVQRHVAIHPDAVAQLAGLLSFGANRGGD
jgi:hypothetical protein